MPDVQSVFVRAPYEADLTFGRNRLPKFRVEETFEIPIAAWEVYQTQRAALVTIRKPGEDHRINFIGVDGRLF